METGNKQRHSSKHFLFRFVKRTLRPIKSVLPYAYHFLRNKMNERLTDEQFVRRLYWHFHGSELNLDNPITFNEKLMWLNLCDQRPEYALMADKYAVRKYLREVLCERVTDDDTNTDPDKLHLIPLLGVWDKWEDIDFTKLPNQFVLKCNHDCASVVFCKDKGAFNYRQAKRKINHALKSSYYEKTRERQYKTIRPCIIAEKYMVDESNYELKDYKLFTFSGKVKYIQVDFDRFISHKRNIFDRNWVLQDFTYEYPGDPEKKLYPPKSLDKMIEIAEELAFRIPLVRVDFYEINGLPYFGEFTFSHGAGTVIFPDDWDKKWGDLIELPKKE